MTGIKCIAKRAFRNALNSAACCSSLWLPRFFISSLLCRERSPILPIRTSWPLFQHFPIAWLIFLMLLTGLIGSVTSISVDFSDGLDGLAGGLVFSAALAFGIIFTGLLN